MGILLAVALLVGSTALASLTDSRNADHREWVAERKGDAAILALAVSLCASGLLVAALVAGLLT